MNKFPTIENFLENAFEYEDLNELLRYLKEIGNGCLNRPLNIYGQSNCGKTALARLLKEMFKDDAVIMDSWRFLSKFNNHWADKKLVIIDERFITDAYLIVKVVFSSTMPPLYRLGINLPSNVLPLAKFS